MVGPNKGKPDINRNPCKDRHHHTSRIGALYAPRTLRLCYWNPYRYLHPKAWAAMISRRLEESLLNQSTL
ncbi:unnamed protein product, partial [Dovyalis caffra]